MYKINSTGKHVTTHNVENHCHSAWEVIYVTSGSGVFSFDEHVNIEYLQGDTIVIPPKLNHKNTSENGFTNIFVTFENAALPFDEPIKISNDINQALCQVLSQIYFFYNCDISNKENILYSLAELLTNLLISLHKKHSFSLYTEKIQLQIIKNFSNPSFEISQILPQLPYNYDYLRKLFRDETGKTPLQTLQEVRLNQAKNLLRNQSVSGMNINEIASLCGFSDPLYFSRSFKSYFKISPRDFAKNPSSILLKQK